MDPLDFIVSIRKLFGVYSDDSFGCYRFMMLLIKVFGGKGYYNNDHCLTKIGDYYYDILGRYREDESVWWVYEGVLCELPVKDFLSIDDVIGWDHMRSVFHDS